MTRVSLLSICSTAVLAACATFAPKPPLPISDVVRMSESGVPPQEVVERIEAARTSYALRGSDFAKLKARGVSDPVLDYLQRSLVRDVDVLTRYGVTGPHLGGCAYCYPQPLDLRRVVSGYNVGNARKPGRYAYGLPPGVPDWVAGNTGSCSCEDVSVSQVVEMSSRGVPDEQIVALLRRSRLAAAAGHRDDVSLEQARPPVEMSGANLARLHEEGVSDAVLDELQARFLGQLVEAKRLEYQNWL